MPRLLSCALLLMLTFVFAAQAAPERPRVDLTGTWDFYANVGDATLESAAVAPGKIVVPGAWQAQGYGQPGGLFPSSVIGSDLSPADHLRHNLTARCLYVRDAQIPGEWQGRRVFLCVRRVYRYADVTINGSPVGQHEGFCSPCEFDMTSAVRWGQTNRIVIGIDNRQRPERDTVGTANYLGNWGGIGGDVYLECRPPEHVVDVFAIPQLAASQVVLHTTVTGTDEPAAAELAVCAEVQLASASGGRATASLPLSTGVRTEASCQIDLPVELKDVHPWTPETPHLYTARVRLLRGTRQLDELTIRFGMREITADGNRLYLNGKPLYLSGYGDDATEPITGMLPADKEVYRRRLALMRSLGFNFVRHHSCVPHDEYLDAADEVGMLVQPEAGMAYIKYWPKAHGLFSNEWPQIIRALRNHPSIWAWCMGNEMFLDQLPETRSAEQTLSRGDALKIVARAYQQAKELDPTRLVHASDGGTPHPHTDIVSAGGWEPFGTKPFLLHEYGAYACSLPDFSLIPRLNGVIRPLTYERAAGYVREHQLAAIYPRLYDSSLFMRADAQKHYLEVAKSRDDNAGFSFWLGVDFPDSPEGCWDEGILNQLWEPKPHLTEGLSQIVGPTVLLCSAGIDARSFYSDERQQVELFLWHYGSEPISDARLAWQVTDGAEVLAAGQRNVSRCDVGQKTSLGHVAFNGPDTPTPRLLTLRVELLQDTRRLTDNAWEFYAYPRARCDSGTSSPPEGTPAAAGVYSEAGPLPGTVELRPDQPIPADLRLLISDKLTTIRHSDLLQRGGCAVLLLGTGGFPETRAGYFLNGHGAAFGGIVENHPVFDSIPHAGRLHLSLYQLVAGGGLLAAEPMPAPLRDGSVVWGLRLTAWISPAKDLNKVIHWSEVVGDNRLHLVLCNLDLRSQRPESRYVLHRTLDYLLQGQPSALARPCTWEDLKSLLR